MNSEDIVKEVESMGLMDLFDFVMYNPRMLVDGYYLAEGEAIRKRYKYFSKLIHNGKTALKDYNTEKDKAE